LLRILAGKKLAKAGKVSVNNVDPFKDYAEVRSYESVAYARESRIWILNGL